MDLIHTMRISEITAIMNMYFEINDIIALLLTCKEFASIDGLTMGNHYFLSGIIGSYLSTSKIGLNIILDCVPINYIHNAKIIAIPYYTEEIDAYMHNIPPSVALTVDSAYVKVPDNTKRMILRSEYHNKYGVPQQVEVITLYDNMSEYQGIKLPNTVKMIVFHGNFNAVYDPTYVHTGELVPNSVESISFGERFNDTIKGLIPNSVTSINFGYYFNRPIKDAIHNLVKYIVFGNNFDQPIDDAISESIECLEFGFSFNQPLKKKLPKSLKYLIFGGLFNQSIEGILPESLEYLVLGRSFCQKIDLAILKNIKSLAVGIAFGKFIAGKLPKTITKLALTEGAKLSIGSIPHSVIDLTIDTRCDSIEGIIPDSVKYLRFGDGYYSVVRNTTLYIPSSVTHLKCGQCFQQLIVQHEPVCLTHLTIHESYPIKDMNLPSSIIDLEIIVSYYTSLDSQAMKNIRDHIRRYMPKSVNNLRLSLL